MKIRRRSPEKFQSASGAMPRPFGRGTFCISCRSRKGRDRCGRLSRRRERAWELRPACCRSEIAFAVPGGAACVRFLQAKIARDRAAPAVSARILQRAARLPQRLLGRPHQEEEPHGFGIDAIHHLFEECERFLLELDQRIFLSVAAQADAFLQVVEREEVVFPLGVHDVEQDVALEPAQRLRAEETLLSLRSARELFR